MCGFLRNLLALTIKAVAFEARCFTGGGGVRLTEAEGLSAGGGLGRLLGGGAGDGGGIWADGEGGVLGGCHGVGALKVCMWSQTARR